SFAFSTIINRRFGERDYRFSDPIYKTWFDKQFTWDRDYNLSWDLTKSLKFDFNATNSAVIDEPDEYKDRSQLLRITKEERRDSIWNNIKEFGRTKNYMHNVRASYRVPTNLFPFLDWIRADVSYDAEYGWTASSINTDSLGNVIRNGQRRSFSADLDFTRLYNKSKFLGKINGRGSVSTRSAPQRQTQRNTDSSPRDSKGGAKQDEKVRNSEPGAMAR